MTTEKAKFRVFTIKAGKEANHLFTFMESVIAKLKSLGKIRTSETYATSLSSFKRFRKGRDMALEAVDSDTMIAYEAWLKDCGLSPNTSSFYMRTLRAVGGIQPGCGKGTHHPTVPFQTCLYRGGKDGKAGSALEDHQAD